MLLRLLTLISCIHLCAFSSCEDDCFDFFVGGAMEVNLESTPALSYVQGDTLWIAADFAAALESTAERVVLSEAGGLFVSRMFRVGPDSASVLPALTAFTPVATRGDIIFEDGNQDPAATILRYRCPAGRCGFRQGFRLDSVGQYLLEVNGSTYDRADDSFGQCVADGFFETILDAPSNVAAVSLRFPLLYSPESVSGSFIDTSFQRNILYFTVE